MPVLEERPRSCMVRVEPVPVLSRVSGSRKTGQEEGSRPGHTVPARCINPSTNVRLAAVLLRFKISSAVPSSTIRGFLAFFAVEDVSNDEVEGSEETEAESAGAASESSLGVLEACSAILQASLSKERVTVASQPAPRLFALIKPPRLLRVAVCAMQCFVCSVQLVGDSQYIEHHINSCAYSVALQLLSARPGDLTPLVAPCKQAWTDKVLPRNRSPRPSPLQRPTTRPATTPSPPPLDCVPLLTLRRTMPTMLSLSLSHKWKTAPLARAGTGTA